MLDIPTPIRFLLTFCFKHFYFAFLASNSLDRTFTHKYHMATNFVRKKNEQWLKVNCVILDWPLHYAGWLVWKTNKIVMNRNAKKNTNLRDFINVWLVFFLFKFNCWRLWNTRNNFFSFSDFNTTKRWTCNLLVSRNPQIDADQFSSNEKTFQPVKIQKFLQIDVKKTKRKWQIHRISQCRNKQGAKVDIYQPFPSYFHNFFSAIWIIQSTLQINLSFFSFQSYDFNIELFFNFNRNLCRFFSTIFAVVKEKRKTYRIVDLFRRVNSIKWNVFDQEISWLYTKIWSWD